jgi:hypothetical protein
MYCSLYCSLSPHEVVGRLNSETQSSEWADIEKEDVQSETDVVEGLRMKLWELEGRKEHLCLA